MQRHTIRGKTRTIIYPIIICLGITSIMGCKRLEINQTKETGRSYPPTLPHHHCIRRNLELTAILFYFTMEIQSKRRRLAKTKKRNKRQMVEPDRSLAGYHHQSKAGDYKTTEREDFKQHLVRFYWTPLEQTYGYLLEPNKKETSCRYHSILRTGNSYRMGRKS